MAKYAGEDNGWVLALLGPPLIEFDKTVTKFPNIRRFVGGASTDLIPNLQGPDDPVPLLKQQIQNGKEPHAQGGGAAMQPAFCSASPSRARSPAVAIMSMAGD